MTIKTTLILLDGCTCYNSNRQTSRIKYFRKNKHALLFFSGILVLNIAPATFKTLRGASSLIQTLSNNIHTRHNHRKQILKKPLS
jgi:hypothetical protein